MAPVVGVAPPRLRRAAGLLRTYRDVPTDLVDALLVAPGDRGRSIYGAEAERPHRIKYRKLST